MVRIAFLNPPVRADEPAKHVPYGIAQLAAIADEWGAQVAVEDNNATRFPIEVIRQSMKDVYNEDKVLWDIFAFSGIVTTYGWIKETATALRKDWPETLFIVGGGVASALHEKCLEWVPAIDAVAIGEGERTLKEILEITPWGGHLDTQAMGKVKGLYIRPDLEKLWDMSPKPKTRKRQIEAVLKKRQEAPWFSFTGVRPLMSEDELNELPYPAWKFFALTPKPDGVGGLIRGYFASSPLMLSPEAMTAQRRMDSIGERGCAGECRFCSHNLMGGDFIRNDHVGHYSKDCLVPHPDGPRLKPLMRYQSPEYTVGMWKYMRFRYRNDFIAVMDETFLYNTKRAHKIVDLLEDEGFVELDDWHWGCLGRPVEIPDSELLRRMRDAHCSYISYGFESSSQQNLDYLRKHTTPEMQRKTLQATITAGINPITTYIIGYPDETMQTLYDTAKFQVLNGIHVKPFLLTPYLYTPVYWENRDRILEQYGGDEEAFALACGDAFDFIVNLTKRFTDAELRGLQDMMADRDLKGLMAHSRWRHSLGLDEEAVEDPDPPQGSRRPLPGVLA